MKMILEEYWKPMYNPYKNQMECQDYPLKSTNTVNNSGYETTKDMIKELKHRFSHRLIAETLDQKGIIFNELYTIQIVRGE
jgi:hypothetical protein